MSLAFTIFAVIAVIVLLIVFVLFFKKKENFSAQVSGARMITFVNKTSSPIEIARYKSRSMPDGKTFDCKIVPGEWTDAIELGPMERVTMTGWAPLASDLFVKATMMSGNTRDITRFITKKSGARVISSPVRQWSIKKGYRAPSCANMVVAEIVRGNEYHFNGK